MKGKVFLISIVGILCLVMLVVSTNNSRAQSESDAQPPAALEATPTPTPLSPIAQVAVQYVTTKYGVPVQDLFPSDEEAVAFPLLGRKATYITLVYAQATTTTLYSMLVDPATQAIEEDVNAVLNAQRAAYNAKYGKLTPALYERLQAISDTETLPIAIWVNHNDQERPEEEVEAEVIRLHPKAGEAKKESGILWAVKDPDLRVKIKQKYLELHADNVARRTKNVEQWLHANGYKVSKTSGKPTLLATVTKKDIALLVMQSDVAEIFLVETESTPLQGIANATVRIPAVWSRGYTGTGVKLAILEKDRINATALGCLNVIATGPTPLASTTDSTHKSLVAAIAACNNSTWRGVAPNAQIIEAVHAGNETSADTALEWAVSNNSADVVNQSEKIQTDSNLNFLDKAYDYWVRLSKFTGVIGAGNETTTACGGGGTGNVTTPAKAYNVIAVGSFDDMDTTSWSDDMMYSCSSTVNPTTGVEKPEVAASGTTINTIVPVSTPQSGTSLAAPQVAGVAALLMSRQAALKDWPSTVKAIIMASAIHNIEGSKRLSAQDGAGGIDANLADQIAQTVGGAGDCNAPCWWNISTSNAVQVGQNYQRTFNATRGERIRVVISWLSQADARPYTNDSLKTNYNLTVLNPNLSTAATSDSLSNNFEIVDFTATQTGQYKIQAVRVAAGDQNESSNFLGMAWVKENTYLPEIRTDNGWSTTIYVRNDGAEPWDGKLTFFNANGSFQSESAPSGGLAANTVWSGATLPANWRGSAIFEGNDNVSVMVVNQRASAPFSSSAYTGVPNTKTSGTFYLPLVMRNAPSASGTVNSEILIQNTAGVATSVQVQFYGSPANFTKTGITIAPGATYVYNIQNETNLANGWVGTAVVTGGQLNVISHLRIGTNNVQTYQGLTAENVGTAWSMPFFFSRLANGLSSPVAVQNVSTTAWSAGTVNLSCVKDPGSPAPATLSVNNNATIPINGAFYFNPVTDTSNFPTGWYGACRATTPGNAVSFVQMRFVGIDNAGAYEALPGNSVGKVAVFPLIQKRVASGGYTLGTSLAIQNLSTTAAANVKFHYRSNAGVDITAFSCVIPAGGSVYHNHRLTDPNTTGCNLSNGTMPDGWTGSLVVTSSDQPIAGVTQVTNISAPSGDTFMVHNANLSP
jgi:Subtilase family